MISTQQSVNNINNKSISNAESKLVKAKFSPAEIEIINKIKLDNLISTDSKALRYIVAEYSKQEYGESKIKKNAVGESTSAKVESLKEELAELKKAMVSLTNENKKLHLNVSELPFKDKLNSYSNLLTEELLHKTKGTKGTATSFHEVNQICRDIPKDVFTLYHNEMIEIYDQGYDEGFSDRGDHIEKVADKQELNDLIVVSKDHLTAAFQRSSKISFGFIQNNGHMVDAVTFAKWYKNELQSVLNHIEKNGSDEF
jgi:regulator of replication initiation timing